MSRSGDSSMNPKKAGTSDRPAPETDGGISDHTGKTDEKKAVNRTGKRIGLIAGGGQFPMIFSRKARDRGYRVFAAAYVKEADQQLAGMVDAVEWLHLGQVKRLIRFFKRNGVEEAVMMGSIRKTRMFTDVRPDIKAISILAGMRHTHDDGVLRAFAGALEEEGIRVRDATFLLPELLAPEGLWTKRKPNRGERADIELGLKLAREIGRLDIGQCVVLGGGSVLAVEAIEGTDAAIRRGAALGDGGAVVVKICKPNQDTRFDVPAVGAETIRTMIEAGADVLAVETGRAVVFNREEMVALADRHKIAVIGV